MILDGKGRPVPDVPLTEAQVLELLAAELQTQTSHMVLGPFEPTEALMIAGLLQLAMRHPDLGVPHRELAAEIVDAVREYFHDAPTALAVIDRGDDPTQDMPR